MKVFMLVLLAILMFGEQAHALVCFKCNKKKYLLGCLKISFCSIDDKYCVSQTTSSTADHQLKHTSKYCSPVCPSNGHVSGVTTMNTRCCHKSLCNVFSNDGGLQTSSLVLGLSVLCSLLYTPGMPGA